MINHKLDTAHSILYVTPQSPLEQSDFVELAKTVDPYIEQTGDLAGLIIQAPKFPGWESLGAMVAHIHFVRDHHAEHLASHFVSAEVRHFSAGEVETAKQWIIDQP